ncbi:MAG: hypothetical protein ACPLRZ_07845 [Thermovenabulum sp.]
MEELLKEILAELKKINDKFETRQKTKYLGDSENGIKSREELEETLKTCN